MVKTVAILAFIGAAGAGATVLALKKTVIDGKVIAADIHGNLEAKGITEVTCDPEIPVEVAGAKFVCKITAGDGSTADLEVTIDRGAKYTSKVLASTGPTREQAPPSGDPWNN